MNNQTIDAQLLQAEVAIHNATTNDAVKSAMALYGYDTTKVAENQALLDQGKTLHTKQKKEYGEQYSATDALSKSMKTADKWYIKHVKIARIALKNERGIWQSLQINGRRKKSQSGWVSQATVFYLNALSNPDVLTAMNQFGVSQEVLASTQLLVQDVANKLSIQLKETGEAQDATIKRDEALDLLMDWMSDFKAIARIALEDDAQLLEMLGIVKAAA
ncbi:hypothetical protein N6H18_03105 [Reichenbachiella agarivorans]|uniref:Uncharacterized protein n=1 Tax=Reichenbachiella agarivorans TaxID=2979464 RepID=A0ABY6CR21_9BACT|nr:hypothetical protein [Reichenbachiella agarivorans]UXP32943.1 hypothetical protein N6H18_03105 [Reichenbachiella agarivorans]